MALSRTGNVLALLVAVGASASAGAAVIVVQGSIASRPTNFNQFINIAQFDPSLGTLESVDIVASVGYDGRHFGENMSATNSATFLSRLTYNVSLTGEGIGGAIAANVNERAGALTIHDGVYDNGGSSGYTFNFADAATSLASLTGVDFASFVGLGTVQYNMVATASAYRTASGGVVAQGTSSRAFGEVTVTYTYTAIPAPGAAGALLCGLALFTRRRR